MRTLGAFGIILLLLFFISACDEEDQEVRSQYEEVRRTMIETQIKARGVTDPKVIQAMESVPREQFVPDDLRGHAHDDSPLPIGHSQTISQPYIVAFMAEALRLKGGEKVLEIGTGSGYNAAVLSKIASEVYSIEIVAPLGEQAKKLLHKMKYYNVHVRIGDGYQGWPEFAPFDAIILTAAPPKKVPPSLVKQLKEGGVLVAPIGDVRDGQNLNRYRKKNGILEMESLLPVRFVPMTGRALED